MELPVLGITAISNRPINREYLLSIIDSSKFLPLNSLFLPLLFEAVTLPQCQDGIFAEAMERANGLLNKPDVSVGVCQLTWTVTEPACPSQLQANFVAFSCRILGNPTPVLLATPPDDYDTVQRMLTLSYGSDRGCGLLPPLLSLEDHAQVMSLIIDALQYGANLI